MGILTRRRHGWHVQRPVSPVQLMLVVVVVMLTGLVAITGF